MVNKYIPDRGDIVLLDFDPQAGKEQVRKRPAIVISPRIYNSKVGLAVFCPITSQIKGYPFEFLLPEKLKTRGAVLTDHVKNLDWKSRNAVFLERLPGSYMVEVLERIRLLLD
ncbi:MAG: type II toxin-antitoxin system PemK/MazF family toxin [Bacteroidetes bacterium]|nr:type II toxin-antitoxin system PemK/MazF family toxin [Bacteroidota bacterium]